ncbi:Protein TONSOKU [Bienertia sinuspersici]
MGKNDTDLSSAKRAFKSAKDVGNLKEEAKWANVIGDILKNRGEYCQALQWARIDYQVSTQHLLVKDRLPSCQSMGELYLRLQDFENALYYQKEHLRLAKEADDLAEEQRAATQLGRTYHEIFFKSEDHSALHKAKKYFKSAMSLARTLKENPPDSKSSFLKEYIDAYNNVGMLEMDLDNLEESEKILTKGLEICDEEEVNENDDGRSRLHHNLGYVYTKLRMWTKAREHINKDITICKNIGHRQGEAKGYNNLGELYCKVQKFDEALSSYRKAFELAKSLEDEYALARQVEENIRVVKEYVKVMEEIKKEEQNFKKLRRGESTTKGTSGERKYLKQLMTSLDNLVEKTSFVADWKNHRKVAKMKKKIAGELCDQEKLADSYLVVGESYQKLRNFQKARKWYAKSLEIYKVIGNLEGQAIATINMGDILDCEGDWKDALKTFEEGYRKLKLQIEDLQALVNSEQKPHTLGESCSETDTEGNDNLSENRFADLDSSRSSKSPPVGKHVSSIEDIEDDEALSSLSRCRKFQKLETDSVERVKQSSGKTAVPLKISNSLGSPSKTVSRKRNRLVLSDDEEDEQCLNRRLDTTPLEDIATSNELKSRTNHLDQAGELQEFLPDGCKHDSSSCNLVNHEESACSHKSSPVVDTAHRNFKSFADNKCGIRIKVEDISVCIEAESSVFAGELDIEALKAQAACAYYLQLSSPRRSNGLLPIIRNLKFGEHILTTNYRVETIFADAQAGGSIEASIDGQVQKRLIKLYVDCCQKLSEPPNMKLLMKLYNLELSEDEVIVSDCEVQDMSVVPLLEALSAHKTISMLDLSHNMLGNATMERLNQALTLSGQKYGALVLDLHSNLFGPTALFQICECPVLFSRLEVLNISGNRLTDACGTYLSTILSNCTGLYSLNIERCSITSRTIQTVADALNSGSVLSQLFVGYNNPVSGNSLAKLLEKLAKLERFSELSLDGIKLNKHALDSVCQLARSSSLSGLMLGATNIGSEGALKLTGSIFHETQELVKLNLSYCALRSNFFERLKILPAVLNILELNLAGNPVGSEGGNALASLLSNPECSVKFLMLNKCQLENESLEDLNLAGNVLQEAQHQPTENDTIAEKNAESLGIHCTKIQDPSNEQNEEGGFNQLEVADSYESDSRIKVQNPGLLIPAVVKAKTLKNYQLLSAMQNICSYLTSIADTFYTAWCSCFRGVCRRHVNGQLLHLSTEGKICCGVKPCCKKN